MAQLTSSAEKEAALQADTERQLQELDSEVKRLKTEVIKRDVAIKDLEGDLSSIGKRHKESVSQRHRAQRF